MKRLRTRRLARALTAAAAFAVVVAVPWSDSNAQAGPPYSIGFHAIAAAGQRSHNSCFVVNGTAGQPAPGFSSGGSYGLLAGFWPLVPGDQDQLFFDGFEGCRQ